MKRIVFTVILLVSCMQVSIAEPVSRFPFSISACSDDAEWPDYIYYKRDENGRKTSEVVGVTYDLLKEITQKNNISFDLKLVPWRRCLNSVVSGGQFNVATDAAKSTERSKLYLISEPYYEMTPSLFYLKKYYPKGFPKFKNTKELLSLGSICGVAAYAYEGFIKGLKSNMLDRGSRDFDSVINKLEKKRCVAFLARYEIVKGFSAIGKDFGIGKTLGAYKIPHSKKDKFHFLISKRLPYSHKLKALLDREIKLYKRNRE